MRTDNRLRAVVDDFAQDARRGLRGSPELHLEGHGWVCPSLRIEKVDDRPEIELSRNGFESFLSKCSA